MLPVSMPGARRLMAIPCYSCSGDTSLGMGTTPGVALAIVSAIFPSNMYSYEDERECVSGKVIDSVIHAVMSVLLMVCFLHSPLCIKIDSFIF